MNRIIKYALVRARHTRNKKKPRGGCRGLFQLGAGNEIRTRDPNLGKVVLYQLSYSRLIQEGRIVATVRRLSTFSCQHGMEVGDMQAGIKDRPGRAA